ncbi:hypothetical protein ABZS66_60850 [Dactylosporangium sp. NPDC005572]|uniref:hypothetical protein n=1 Tax=Dactylosporangium sp. NPDC005572 TaxID=3156889 RepID=UPI00339E07EE
MSQRHDPSWRVLSSHESSDRIYCVDFFTRPDGTYGFEEFRRDPEDMGGWTPVTYYAALSYPSLAEAISAAAADITWYRPTPLVSGP